MLAALATASSGQVTTTATLSSSIDVAWRRRSAARPRGAGPRRSDPGGRASVRRPDVPAGLRDRWAGGRARRGTGEVTVVDAEVVQGRRTGAGQHRRHAVRVHRRLPAASLLCYEAVDVVADPGGTAAGAQPGRRAPRGEACSPARRHDDGGPGTVHGHVRRPPHRGATASADEPCRRWWTRPRTTRGPPRSCDYGDVGPGPVNINHESGVVAGSTLGRRPCAVVLTLVGRGLHGDADAGRVHDGATGRRADLRGRPARHRRCRCRRIATFTG